VAHLDAGLVEQLLHIPKRQGETNVDHQREADHLR
jgi:hypothetical protein